MRFFKLAAFSIALIAALSGGVFYIVFADFLKSRPKISDAVLFEVGDGETLGGVAKDLYEQQLISNRLLFEYYAKVLGQANKLKVGEYQITVEMSPAEILKLITSGKSFARTITVSEGLNIFEIASLLERSGLGSKVKFLGFVRDPSFASQVMGFGVPSLEGYLFPETYAVTKYMDERALIELMVRRFREVWATLPDSPIRKSFNIHQIVTLASIIEKETGAEEERPLISSVFHNRLQKRMRLQTDPTILYGLALQSGRIVANIKREHLSQKTSYNTYVISGLPPGPIANPGREALEATLAPADSKFLYFVSRNNGTHVFSETYEAHSKAVRDFQMNPKARKGRSWRELKQGKNRDL